MKGGNTYTTQTDVTITILLLHILFHIYLTVQAAYQKLMCATSIEMNAPHKDDLKVSF